MLKEILNMFRQELPQGKEVSLIKGIYYNIPGIFLCSKLVYLFIDMVEKKFGYRLPIKYIYGSPQLRWNGGRLILNYHDNLYSLHEIENEISDANKRGLMPLLTFSNTALEKEDLHDKKCNEVLRIVRYFNAGVIVSSDLLFEYIKDHYPTINIHASVIKTAYEKKRDIYYYNSLAKKYDYYVIHPDDNFDEDLLNLLPKKNAEIIVNERCFYNCQLRSLHYNSISVEQITQSENNYQNENFLKKCDAIPEYKQSYIQKRNISLTVPEMRVLHEMGYNFFKIQGRTDSLHLFFFDLMRYTLENKMAFPHMYAIFSPQIEKFIK